MNTDKTGKLIALAVVMLTVLVSGRMAAADDVLSTLRKGHPRLMLTPDDPARLRALIQSDPLAAQWHRMLVDSATKILDEKPVDYVLIGPRLLETSRTALQRITLLAGLYQIDGDKRFAQRARRELLDIAAFKDWHPPHFLDTAEMTNAAAIGYDWLYDYLSPDDRRIIRTAIVEKGLNPGLAILDHHKSWSINRNNWNQVCNGGLTVGALAIADEEPDVARRVIDDSRWSIPHSLASYAPDGGWEEGPGYWQYATSYTVYYLASLKSALGTDFDLDKTPGLDKAGFFRLQMIGPTNLNFNFADAGTDPGTSPAMFWLARQFNQPAFALQERQLAKNKPSILDLVWYVPQPTSPAPKLPLDTVFKRINVGCFRGSWDDPRTTFVGFMGGDNQAGHSHLQLGQFVMDAQGRRWADDMGSDDYNLPGYFGAQRFTYYRLGTQGQNTITLDGQNQDEHAKAPIIAFKSDQDRSFAVIDMSKAYPAKFISAFRGVFLLHRQDVLIQDDLNLKSSAQVVWHFHTTARIQCQGNSAKLHLDDADLTALILSPKDAHFDVLPVNPPPPQRPAPGMQDMVVQIPAAAGNISIVVLLSPGESNPPSIKPLSQWVADANGN